MRRAWEKDKVGTEHARCFDYKFSRKKGMLALAGAARGKAGSTLYEKSEAQRCEEGE